jgi:hypothetical protein
MDEVAMALRDALVAAYRPYVEARLDAAGLPRVEEATAAGVAWLEDALSDLLEKPVGEQWRSPLELLQEAMRFPTEALATLGANPVARAEAVEAALPGDVFDLAPASSQELGEGAWHAHLAWGAAKAAAMRPGAVLITRSLLDRSKVDEAAASAGYRLEVEAGVPSGRGRFAVGFVDLEHPDSDEAIRRLVGICGRVVAYGPHVDDMAMIRARSLGAEDAVPRSRFFKDPAVWLLPLR